MIKPRIVETENGIQGEFDVIAYDKMMRDLRDRGWVETDMIIKKGMNKGLALEIGPGPGYLGLEWLKKTEGTSLQTLEISPNMLKTAQKNAKEYGLEKRIKYTLGNAEEMPLGDNMFDGAFTNGSLHEWSRPEKVFNEINRVLKPGGRYLISDLRRDMSSVIKWFLKFSTKSKEMKSGLISSINAAYTFEEIQLILKGTKLRDGKIEKGSIGLVIAGEKLPK